jgi:hypothetical protein
VRTAEVERRSARSEIDGASEARRRRDAGDPEKQRRRDGRTAEHTLHIKHRFKRTIQSLMSPFRRCFKRHCFPQGGTHPHFSAANDSGFLDAP